MVGWKRGCEGGEVGCFQLEGFAGGGGGEGGVDVCGGEGGEEGGDAGEWGAGFEEGVLGCYLGGPVGVGEGEAGPGEELECTLVKCC